MLLKSEQDCLVKLAINKIFSFLYDANKTSYPLYDHEQYARFQLNQVSGEVLLDWINDELSELRIALRDITEDLYDGQILAILMEKLANIKLAEFEEVTQLVDSQKAKLSVLLGHVNKLLGIPDHCAKWTANSIHDKNIVAILHLLVALARHFECLRKLTSGVRINLVVVQKKGGILPPQKLIEEITVATEGEHTENGKPEKDAFDALFDNAPEKLNVVKKSLQGFVNKHLNKLSLEVADIDSQFHDGVYLIFLLGLLEGFVVPLYQFYITLSNKDEKLHNVALAIDLMRDSGMKFYAKSEVMEQLDDQLMDLIVDPWLIQETDIDLVFWEDDESIEISDDDTIEISDDEIIEISDDESRSTEDPFLPETITISDDASSSVTVGIGDDLVETILISDDEAEEQETKHLRIILRKIIPTPLQLKRLKNRQKKENKVI